jgi:hypothetical protein
MSEFELTTPVVFIIFNRPDTAAKVFEKIREAKPRKLLVVADGPRDKREGEAEKCAETRAILEKVDWDCEVLTNFSEVNLGCKRRVSSGLDWAFDMVEEAIILEDDCLPHRTFFRFCQELLAKYRDDERIMMISGDNMQFGKKRINASYYFSQYNHIWGWASWRRAWKTYYDVNMKLWPMVRDGGWLKDIVHEKKEQNFWHQIYERVYRGNIDTWDYQWNFACWINSGLTILPNVNLVSNLGFAQGAAHTTSYNKFADMAVEELKFPLDHPSFVIRNTIADKYEQNDRNFNFLNGIANRLIRYLKGKQVI